MCTLALLASAWAGASAKQLGDTDNKKGHATPGVLPPNSHAYGKSYAEWSVAWWQWAYGLPVTGHPLFDETGANAANGQSGHVWFLGGVFNVSGSAHRNIAVPTGTPLFFPIINVEWDNVCPLTDPPMTADQLAAQAAAVIDGATDLVCTIDGRSVADLAQYRVRSGPFSITIPNDNIFQTFGCSNGVPGTYSPLMNDGYYVMLAPLSRGHHTIHFHGTLPAFGNFTLDIVYDIDVVQAGCNTIAADRPSFSQIGLGASSPHAETAYATNPIRGGDGVLRFTLSRPGVVDARLFDVRGREVRVLSDGGTFSTGVHELRFNRGGGSELAPGMYFYRITTPDGERRGQVTVLR